MEDVRLALEGSRPIHFVGRTGGMIPTPGEVLDTISNAALEGEPDYYLPTEQEATCRANAKHEEKCPESAAGLYPVELYE